MGWGSRCSEKSHSWRSWTKATVQSCKQSLTRVQKTGQADPGKSFLSFANRPPMSQVSHPTKNATNCSFLKERLNPIGSFIVLSFVWLLVKLTPMQFKQKCVLIRCTCQPRFVSFPKESVPETNLNRNFKCPMAKLSTHRILHPK